MQSRILLSHKKNGIMTFAATWMDLEIIIQSQRQIPYGVIYMWSLKKLYKWTYLQNRNRLQHCSLFFIFILFIFGCIMWHVVPSPTRDWTHTPCSISTESYLLDHQSQNWFVKDGKYLHSFWKKKIVCVHHIVIHVYFQNVPVLV